MNIRISIVLSLSLLIFAASAEAQSLRQSRICIDNTKNKVVLRRRCKAPRFTEVTPEFLTSTSADESVVRLPEVITNVVPLFALSNGEITGNTANCPEGKIAIGGGVGLVDNNKFSIRASQPRSNLSGWTGRVTSEKSFASAEMTVYAVCAVGVPDESDDN